jgi:hypothetical protein
MRLLNLVLILVVALLVLFAPSTPPKVIVLPCPATLAPPVFQQFTPSIFDRVPPLKKA